MKRKLNKFTIATNCSISR